GDGSRVCAADAVTAGDLDQPDGGPDHRRGRAPRLEMHLAARALPAARASAGGLPASQGGRKPAMKASPAPVSSTTRSTASAGARTGSGRLLAYQSAPSALSLITTCGNQAVSTFA